MLDFFFPQKYFYFLQIIQILLFCSGLQSKAGTLEGDLRELGALLPSKTPVLPSLSKSSFKAGHHYFSAAVFLSNLNKPFKLGPIDVRPDSEAVSSFVYPQLVWGCFVLFWDSCLLLGLAVKLCI